MKSLLRDKKGRFIKGIYASPKTEFKKGHIPWNKGLTNIYSEGHIQKMSETTHLRQGNHCQLSQKAINFIDGEMLGDGNLNSQSKYSANFRYSSKYLEYINYISNALQSFGIEQSGKINKRYHKNCCDYNYISHHYAELLNIYKKWYPEGKKIVPRNIELSSLTCKQWYIGDGSLKHPKKWGNPYVRLATCGFTALDVEWLVSQLNKLGFKAKRWISENIIGISPYSTKIFLIISVIHQ